MKKDVVKPIRISTSVIISEETGEVIDTSVNTIKILINPDDFCLVYAGLWNVILNSPLSKSDIELFAYLISKYSDGTSFAITGYIKKEISKQSGKSITTYDRSTSSLLTNDLIYKVDKQVYKINPKYAFKGSSKNRHKAVIEMLEINN